MEHCAGILQGLTFGLTDVEIHDSIHDAVCKEKTHEEVCLGLLMTILTEPEKAEKSYRDLTLFTRDGLAGVLNFLNQLILEKFMKLNDIARSQTLWLLHEMIKTNVSNVDTICFSLLRYAAGGDISQKNLFLIENLLDIFQEHRLWLDKFPFLTAFITYTYLRLIEDHTSNSLAHICSKEITFVVSLIREKFNDCLVIGR